MEKAWQALEGRKEFAIVETDNTITIDYIVISDDTFSDDELGRIRRNFRGVVFSKKTGEILSLPFHKFFNLNQTVETQFHLHRHKKAVVFEKLDGSMIHFFRMPDGSVTCSTCRSTNSIQAKQAKEFAFNNSYLLQKIVQSIDYGLTPIFEWVAPHNQIVCHYKSPRLVYLNSRNRSTGAYFFEEKYSDKALRYDIEFSDILNYIHEPEMEGYVCHLSCGTILKVKTPWYLTRHRAVDIMMSPQYKVMDLALQGCLDDVISNAPDMHKQVLINIESVVKNDIIEFQAALVEEYKDLTKSIEMNDSAHAKKQVAAACQTSPNFPALMMIYQEKDTKSFIRKKLYEKYKSLYPNKLLNSEI